MCLAASRTDGVGGTGPLVSAEDVRCARVVTLPNVPREHQTPGLVLRGHDLRRDRAVGDVPHLGTISPEDQASRPTTSPAWE
jgi:hypothetical protein